MKRYYGEGRNYPYVWDSTTSEWIEQAGNTDGTTNSVTYGETQGGVTKRLRVDDKGQAIVVAPRETFDAFGRQRVSQPFTIFDSKQINGPNPLDWDTALVGTGISVYDQTKAASILSTAAIGDSATRQTYRRLNYQPGKSQLIFLTGVLRNAGTFSDGVVSGCGQVNGSSGLFFHYTEPTGLSVGIRKNGSDTLIPQADWNLDKLDGTGPSGITLDITKTQIFVINYEWLAVGSVWFGFTINGSIIWAHRNDNANLQPEAYMQTPNNPLRFWIDATASATGVGSMTQICCSVNSEGGADPGGNTLSVARMAPISLDVGDTNPEQILIALRYKDTSAAQIEVDTNLISVLATGGVNDAHLYLVRIIRNQATQTRNAADTGPAVFTWSSIQNSALEVARPQNGVDEAYIVSDDFLGTSGSILDTQLNIGRASGISGLRNTLKLGFSLAGVSDILTISAFPYANTNVYASIGWREL